jgi:Fe-S-cluster containining protein
LRLAGQVRRQYLCRFRPAYVARVAAERRGECLQCGACCHLTFHCPFLTPERRCTVYHKRSRTCRDFPIDAADLRLTRVPCGHHFDSRREEEARADSSG